MTDLMLPYHQLTELIPNEQSLTPDTFSYVLGRISNLESFIVDFEAHLKNELFIFDDTKLMVSESIGVDPEHFQTVSKRVDLLTILFSILLIFSLISFSAFYATQCINKKKEAVIRQLCGANKKQLIVQNHIEIMLLSCYLVLMVLTFTPLTSKLAHLIIPTINTFKATANTITIMSLFIGFIIYLFVLNFLQDKTTMTHIGRGSSASLSEKVQVFTLLSFLISLAILSVYISYLVISSQINLNNHNKGFKSTGLSIASFDFPATAEHSFMADNSAQQLILQLNSLAYIDAVALTNVPPLTERSAFSHWYTLSGKAITSSKNAQTSNHRVTPNYFNTMGTRLIMGDSLSWEKYTDIVVNKALWERYFSNTDLRQAYLLTDFGNDKVKHKVVGVVENIHIKGSDTPVQPTIYTLISVITGFESIVIKLDKTAPISVTQDIMSISSNINPHMKNVVLVEMSELVKEEEQPRKAILMITIICSLVLLLSALLYCYHSVRQLVSKCATEISLKRAVGARTKSIVWSFCKLFLLVFSVVHSCIFACAYFNMEKLKPFIYGVDLIEPAIIAQVHLIALPLVIVVFIMEIKRILNTSWTSLS